MIVSISSLLILFRFSKYSWFSLGRLCISRTLSISSNYWFLCHKGFHNSLIWSFVYLWYLWWVLLSHFWFCYMGFSLYSLVNLASSLSILLIFSRNQFFVLLIFCVVFLFSISLNSAVIFIIFFFSADFGIHSFSSSLKCDVKLFTWNSLVSWDCL